jgi:hypothetical protein
MSHRTAASAHHPEARDGASFRETRAPRFNAWLEPGD